MTKWGEDRTLASFIQPNHRPEVAASDTSPFRLDVSQRIEQGVDPYPFLAQRTTRIDSVAEPSGPRIGPSMPISGYRLDSDRVKKDPYDKLSVGLSDYNYKRTMAIMKGARAGC